MVNKIILIGNVGTLPEISETGKGVKRATIRFVTSEFYQVEGEKRRKQEWHTLVFWRKYAEYVVPHLVKGMKLFVEGKVHYERRKGENIPRTFVEVERFRILDKLITTEEPKNA
jgi:single-strand binding protein